MIDQSCVPIGRHAYWLAVATRRARAREGKEVGETWNTSPAKLATTYYVRVNRHRWLMPSRPKIESTSTGRGPMPDIDVRHKLYIDAACAPSSGPTTSDVVYSATDEVMGRGPDATAQAAARGCAAT